MSYLRNKKRKTTYIVLPIVVVGIILLLTFTPILKWGFDSMEKAFVIKYENNQVTRNFISSVFLNKKKLDELQDLSLENERLRLEIDILSDSMEELEELRSVFSLNQSRTDRQVVRIIARPPVSGFDTLILDKPEDISFDEGDLVLTQGKVLLGKIAEVFDRTMRVELFTDQDSIIIGRIPTRDIEQEIRGRGAGNFIFKVPREIEIEVGDRIYSPSQNNYLLGIVEAILSDPRNPNKTILAVPPVNLNNLEMVEILKN